MKIASTRPYRFFRWIRQLLLGIAPVIIACTGLAAFSSPASAAPANGYYSVPYSNVLYYHYEGYGSAFTIPASYDQWVGDGAPRPTPVGTDFVKYPWSPTIYAVSYFDGGWVWSGPLAFAQWQRAGFPAPRIAGYIGGTTYAKWDTSNEIFATAPDNTTDKLSYGEWSASGFQEPIFKTNQGYQKLSWDDHIAYMYQINTGDGVPTSYSDWASAGFPTPQTVSRFPGDRFCQFGNSVIYYYGPTMNGQLTYAQWSAAGSPQPTAC